MYLLFEQNVHLRAKPLPWLRHMKRGSNEVPNQLATMGKKLGRNDLVMMMETMPSAVDNAKYWRGQFDGGYDPGSTTIGVGMYLCFSEQCPHENSVWTSAVKAYGRCDGSSSTEAELTACKTLIYIAQQYIAPFYPPFSSLPPPW